jgi:sugar lactone lactonase YvrE
VPAIDDQVTSANVAVDTSGNLLLTEENRLQVRAGSTGTLYGKAMTAGDIYTVAGDGKYRYSGDGGPATSAGLNPDAVTVDAAGNLVIADAGNLRVRVVAESTGTFYGVPMIAGDIYTVAGGAEDDPGATGLPATEVALFGPQDVAVDAAGNLVITQGDHVWVVAASAGTFYGQQMLTGYIYSIAGTGTAGYSGDGGPATKARFSGPAGVVIDGAGDVYIADAGNYRIRKISG